MSGTQENATKAAFPAALTKIPPLAGVATTAEPIGRDGTVLSPDVRLWYQTVSTFDPDLRFQKLLPKCSVSQRNPQSLLWGGQVQSEFAKHRCCELTASVPPRSSQG